MVASNTPSAPLLEHFEVPSGEANAPTQDSTPAEADIETAREQERAERARAAMYARFSDGQKRVILVLVSFAGLTQSAYPLYIRWNSC